LDIKEFCYVMDSMGIAACQYLFGFLSVPDKPFADDWKVMNYRVFKGSGVSAANVFGWNMVASFLDALLHSADGFFGRR
jgi:hypothetical protein